MASASPLLSGDTIAALATPQGRGGIAVIRVSGTEVKRIITAVLRCELKERQATYLPFYAADGDIIDQGLAIFFPHPHSFTGEDILELHGHGGPVVVDLLLQRLLQLDVRLARPGEFSERAFLNGKIDLAQAEAIADLIAASSREAARASMRSLQGVFSKHIRRVNEKVIEARMYAEAAIDFTDEEIDFISDETMLARLNIILDELKLIKAKANQGSLLRDGITAVIIGAPNVGKSSLLNCLSGKERAIVTDIPGTTRDVLREVILIDGMPIHIIDTAGLRESEDMIEQEGIRRTYLEMEQADLVLYVMDGSKPIDFHLENNEDRRIIIRNKIDLLNEAPRIEQKNSQTIISLSVMTNSGIDLLRAAIKAQVGFQTTSDGIYLARRRHLDALAKAYQYVEAAILQLNAKAGCELVAEELKYVQQALCEITGEWAADDLLGRIFSSFCIGK